jgi:F0F1-type ATP synthase assembly protein I
MFRCHHCGKLISSRGRVCAYCGADKTAAKLRQAHTRMVLAMSMLCGFLFGSGFGAVTGGVVAAMVDGIIGALIGVAAGVMISAFVPYSAPAKKSDSLKEFN